MRIAPLIVLPLVLSVLVGCAARIQMTREPFQTTYDPSRQDALWQSALTVVQLQNYPIATVNDAAGLIVTDWVEIGTVRCMPFGYAAFVRCKARQKVTITIAKTGNLIVNINRKILL